ncbi:thioesterase family protein [Nocardioides sp. L-11A]|uniref:thioesterase family protein n=1 Tax=Nocardioides sp. L-11A TaxID=3043848 RepID=UPI00370973FC
MPTEFQDANGHMSATRYLTTCVEGVEEALDGLGIPRDWPTTAGHGVFTVDQHLHFLSEVSVGTELTFHHRLVARGPRSGRLVGYLLDHHRHTVCFAMEAAFVHVTMATRRSAPWPEEVAAALDRRAAEHATLPWALSRSPCFED